MSSSSAVAQFHSNVSGFCQWIGSEKMDTSLWLRGEMDRLVDPMLESLFLRLIMSPASQPSLTVSDLCRLIEGEKEETNRLVRGEMDRLVNSLFFRLTNKLLVNIDWNGSNVGDRSQVVNPSDHVKSSNTKSHQIVPKQSSYDPHFHQSHQIEEEFYPKILTVVKRELEDGENEMRLEKIQDNTTQTNQFVTRPSTDDHHLFHQIDSSLEDGLFSNQPISADHQQNGQVNNDTDNDIQDWDEPEIKEDGDDEQMIQIEEEDEEEIVDGTDHEGEVGDDETEIDSDNGEEDEDSQNKESSRLIASPLDKTSPPNQSPIRRQTARIVKRKQTEDQRPKQMANRYSKEDDEEEGEVAEEVISRSVKRFRSSRYTISSNTKQKQIITQSSEKIANRFSTNPIQPNRHLQCSHCLKSFDHQSALQTHLRVHTGERPFECDQCDKRFSKKFNLTQHQLIHQNIKNFQCHQCEKQFTLKQTLDSHLLIHSGERPFPCRHCAKSFIKSEHRTKHEQAIHLHVKSYRCKQCGHTATARSHVITHIRMVHFGLPRSIKEQQELNIIDDRDPRELVEKV